MAKIDKRYHSLLNTILNKGVWYEDPNREGVKRLQIPKYDFKHDMTKGFPAITTKKLAWKSVVTELIWFLRGDSNIKYLVDNGVNIWNKDAYNYYLNTSDNPVYDIDEFIEYIGKNDEEYLKAKGFGNLGRVYGAQWRNWESFKEEYNGLLGVIKYAKHTDQISNLIKNLKEKPLATDHIVTAWNPAELDQMALPPCHFGFQIMVTPMSEPERIKYALKYEVLESSKTYDSKRTKEILDMLPKYKFDLIWDQRSVDTFLGLPFNIASYGLLMHIIGDLTNMIPNMLYGSLRNIHLYENSIKGVKEQLKRDVDKHKKVKLRYTGGYAMASSRCREGMGTLDEFITTLEPDMFKLKGYESYPGIKVEMLERDN